MKKRIVVGSAAVAFTLIGVLSAGAVTSKPVVPVQLAEFSVVPATQGAPVGKVKFAVTNVGRVKHEFVVIKTPRSAGNLLKGDEANEAGAVGEIGDLASGQTKVLTLTLKRGHYALICNVAGHYKAGQFADFYVR